MKPHQNLEVWKRSFELVKLLYNETSVFPTEEKFGLISQIRRCCVSIPCNIAEGAARNTDKELIHFLYIASGSISELDTLLLLSRDLGFLSIDKLYSELEIIAKLLKGLINKIKTRIVK